MKNKIKIKILDGKKISDKIINGLKKEVGKLKSKSKLTLVVVQVGRNPVSQIFINQKKKACKTTGIQFKLFQFPAEISPLRLKKEIIKIAKNPVHSGVIIQLPLPKKFLPEDYLNLIPGEKDIDVLAKENLGRFYQGALKILPPAIEGILRLLKNYHIGLKGKNVVILGTGRLVGNPLALQLLREKATVSVLNEFTKDAPFFTKKADILVSGIGKPGLIKGRMIKRGATVIDAGTAVKDGKLRGDVDFKSVMPKAGYITPVPGGTGPMTVACLLENLIKLKKGAKLL